MGRRIDVLKDISLGIYRGEIMSIQGPSGCGKSTLLHILGGLDRADSGEIQVNGQKMNFWSRTSIRRNHIGFLFQSFYLLEEETVWDNIALPAQIARYSTSVNTPHYRRLNELLERLGLADRKHFRAKVLSGGEKQRVALARALCNNPSLLIADEPTGNLDLQTARSIYDLIQEWTSQEGKGAIIVTHDLELANRADRKYYLSQGQLKLI